METRAQRIVKLAAEEACSVLTAHLFHMDGLGLFSAMADDLVIETADMAAKLGMSEDEHNAQLARLLVWKLS